MTNETANIVRFLLTVVVPVFGIIVVAGRMGQYHGQLTKLEVLKRVLLFTAWPVILPLYGAWLAICAWVDLPDDNNPPAGERRDSE